MKYGIIVNVNTGNVGDDIQSYAAERLLPHVDVAVSRENIDEFEGGGGVSLFMNGWFMCDPTAWPPSPFLHFLPIAFHLSPDLGEYLKFFLEGEYGEYLRKLAPIGCRDNDTVALLERFKIPAYFSGCLTLTIKPFENCVKHGNIILVDLPAEVSKYIVDHTNKEVQYTTHAIRLTAEHSWEMRRSLVEKLLKTYQGASLVVTSRLHVALPCLALGTPVLLIPPNPQDSRINTYLSFVNNTTVDDLLNNNFSYDFNLPKKNPTKHIEIANDLRKKCSNFIKQCEQTPQILPDIKYQDTVKRLKRLKRIMAQIIKNA